MHKYLLPLIVLIVIVACGGSSGSSERICVVDHPMQNSSQLFIDPENPEGEVKLIANGIKCEYIGSFTYTEAGIEIPLYKMSCNGITGYMNRKWVDCD